MSGVHKNISKQYEEIVQQIMADQEIKTVDFPLICDSFQVE